MKRSNPCGLAAARRGRAIGWPRSWRALLAGLSLAFAALAASPPAAAQGAPVPLEGGRPVAWWFAYKFSTQTYPYEAGRDGPRDCLFPGETPQPYPLSQRYVVATNLEPVLREGAGLLGASARDPLAETFAEVYGGDYYFVIWNDQFYHDPPIEKSGCAADQCGGPWGHAKGLLAWDTAGEGLVLQVTTPSWPGAGGADHPRAAGNTLGCVSNDNNVKMAQHFFALKLAREDVAAVLRALDVANVVTDVRNPQIVRRVAAGRPLPPDLDALVGALDKARPSKAKRYFDVRLTSGVRLVAKPSALNVPPWQFLSSVLGGPPLRSATWWASPRIPATTAATRIGCWDASLPVRPGAVGVATAGRWGMDPVPLAGPPNHAKIGVSDAAHNYVVFGDLNQQGQLGEAAGGRPVNCASSQNGRGGLFFVLQHKDLADSVRALISGEVRRRPRR